MAAGALLLRYFYIFTWISQLLILTYIMTGDWNVNLNNIEFIEKNKPATDKEIQSVNTSIKGTLPDVYQEFLKLTMEQY